MFNSVRRHTKSIPTPKLIVKQALSKAFGETTRGIWYIVIGSSLILTSATTFLWLVLKGKARPSGPPVGLILFISPSPHTMEKSIIESFARYGRLQYCFLLTPPKAQQKTHDLSFWLAEQHIHSCLIWLEDAFDEQVATEAVKQALTQARSVIPNQPVVVDITGGSKFMTIGAVLACLELDVPMQCMVATRNDHGFLDDFKQKAINVASSRGKA